MRRCYGFGGWRWRCRTDGVRLSRRERGCCWILEVFSPSRKIILKSPWLTCFFLNLSRRYAARAHKYHVCFQNLLQRISSGIPT